MKKMEGLHEDLLDEAFPIELFEEFEPQFDNTPQELVYPW
jgi:hypothetical protein